MYVLIKSLQCRNLFCMVLGVLSLLLFLYGFFPMKKYDSSIATKNDLPTSVRNVRLNVSSLYQPDISRLVLIVIDALRYDFISGSEGILNMPYLTSLIEEHGACLLAAKANPPTVTMPRIKALTTGTVPNFIDVALNFGSSQILEDNIILQSEKHGLKIVFYGDDTWLKLFPNSFVRKEGTTSFFVSDFHEVDDNVTRHLPEELNSSDWQIMILHYLGLDHIGHIEGPKGSHIKPKLQEMDLKIKGIHQELKNLNKFSQPSAIVICGDHGMKDSGGHGGASLSEILIPFIVVGHKCPGSRSDAAVAQIDLVPTLSVLLGLPIPRSNLGKLILTLLSHLPMEKQLYALFYNTRQVALQYNSNIGTASQEDYLKFEEAVRLHEKWLTSVTLTDPDEIISLYTSALENMSSILAESMVTYDMFTMVVAFSMLCQVFYMLLLTPQYVARSPALRSALVEIMLLAMLLYSIGALYCSYSKCQSLLCSKIIVSVAVTITAAVNTHFIMNFYPLEAIRQVFYGMSLHVELLLLILGSGLQVVSLGATSLIEEEHQVWYFLWTTFSLLTVCRLIISPCCTILLWQTLMNMILHRLLRKWNQTGDKWASLPDIGDWLVEPEHKVYLSLTLFAGLFGVLWSIYTLKKDKGVNILDAILCVLAVTCVYCYRTACGSVILPCAYSQSRGIMEVRIFWCILAILMGRLVFVSDVTNIVSCWLLLSALLHRPHNVVLLAAQVWSSRLLQGSATRLAIVHVWLGMVFYFFQGNSNSLASVDVAAGYVGHEGYNPITVGFLLLVNIYSAPVLSYLLLLTHITRQQFWAAWRVIACMRLLSISVFTGLVMCQRYHLFVWTVFSPKLLYESVHTAVLLVLMITSNLIIHLLKTKNK